MAASESTYKSVNLPGMTLQSLYNEYKTACTCVAPAIYLNSADL